MPRVRIQIGELFAVEPKFTVHLIRLMAAANDLTTVTSCYGQVLIEPKDEVARSRIEGQRAYFFRLAYGHLYEALQVLKDIARDCPHILSEVRPPFRSVYNTIATTIEPLHKALARLRSNATFHYSFPELEKVLQKWGKDAEGEVVLGEIRREIRYALADDALEQVIERAFDLPPTDTEEGSKALKDLLEKILPLQIHFTDYVLGLFYAIQRVYPDMIKIVEEG